MGVEHVAKLLGLLDREGREARRRQQLYELPAVEQRRFERLDPPLTPRRAVVASVASVLLGSQLGALSLRATSFSSSGGRGEREDESDLWELQPLSPAEELVAAIFRPAAQAPL